MSELSTKSDYRREARRRRRALSERAAMSAQILAQVQQTEIYRNANSILAFVGVGEEVETGPWLATALAQDKKLYVPLCRDHHLHLFQLQSLDELAPRTLRIPEPREEWWSHLERFAPVACIDLALVPGVAFGRDGSRIGQGGGYYDRLLAHAAPGRPYRLAVAFECQVFTSVPHSDHDVFVEAIATERGVFPVAPSRRFES